MKRILFGIFCMLLGATAAFAQATAQISGSVTDQSGAVLPGVEITATQTIEFRGEGNNILNHANFNNPNGTFTNAQFGRIQSAQPGRVMQFSLKYLF